MQGRIRGGVRRTRPTASTPPLQPRVPAHRGPRDRRGRRPGDLPRRLQGDRSFPAEAFTVPLAEHDRGTHRAARGRARASPAEGLAGSAPPPARAPPAAPGHPPAPPPPPPPAPPPPPP